MTILIRSISISMFLLLVVGCGAGAPRTIVVAENGQGIRVSGRGEVRATPDLAILDIGVEARRRTVAEARTQAAEAQQAVVDALRAAGVEERDLKTTRLSVQPDYEYSQTGRTLRGYVVTNTVEARISDLDAIQRAIDTAIAAGGDLTRLNGLRFELSEPDAVRRQARTEAIAKARAEAEQIAAELGVRLGEPLSVEESSSAPPHRPIMMRMEDSAAAATPIQPGETEVIVEVQVRWAIVP